LKPGFYQSPESYAEEHHGGAVFRSRIRNYLGYLGEGKVFFICFSGKGLPNWELFHGSPDKSETKGEITKSLKNDLEIRIWVSYRKEAMIYFGREEQDALWLKWYWENQPEKIYPEEKFEYIGKPKKE